MLGAVNDGLEATQAGLNLTGMQAGLEQSELQVNSIMGKVQ